MKESDTSVLYIKNMVCPRCIKVVSEELGKLGFAVAEVQLGKAEMNTLLSAEDRLSIQEALQRNGFDLLDHKKNRITEQIKRIILDGIRTNLFSEMNINLSQYISEQLHLEYSYLSNLFTSVEGKSIERFVILQKTERIKEWISYGELSIKEMADQLGYSSLQALSAQFKKETGMTPTEFKKTQEGRTRTSITDI